MLRRIKDVWVVQEWTCMGILGLDLDLDFRALERLDRSESVNIMLWGRDADYVGVPDVLINK